MANLGGVSGNSGRVDSARTSGVKGPFASFRTSPRKGNPSVASAAGESPASALATTMPIKGHKGHVRLPKADTRSDVSALSRSMNMPRPQPLSGTGGRRAIDDEHMEDCQVNCHVIYRFIEKGEYGKAAQKLISVLDRNPNDAAMHAKVDARQPNGSQIERLLEKSPEFGLHLAKNPKVAVALRDGNPALKSKINHAVRENREKLFAGLNTSGNPIEREVQEAAQALQKTISGEMHRFGANYDAKVVVLKAVGEAARDPIQFGALMQLLKDPKIGPLALSALGSAMGGAEWTKAAHGHHGAADLSANATKVFLRLNQVGILGDIDNKQVLDKLGPKETKALQNPQSPFWAATQQLSLEQRTELADCLSPLPREAYAQSREYLRTEDELDKLETGVRRPFDGGLKGGGVLVPLNIRLKELGVDLQKNGCIIPEHLLENDQVKRELDKPGIREALEGAQKQMNDPRLSELRKRVPELKSRLAAYNRKDLLSTITPVPADELAQRMSLIAGKHNATFSDCFAAIKNDDPQLKKIDSHQGLLKDWQSKQSRQGAIISAMSSAQKETSPEAALGGIAQCAEGLEQYCEWFMSNLDVNGHISQARINLGLGIDTREMFALRGKGEMIPFANATVNGLLGEVTKHIPMSDDAREQFNVEFRQAMGSGATPKTVAQLIGQIQESPEAFGLAPDYKFPATISNVIRIAKKIDSFE
jgi:hypothetical protein